MAEERAAFRFKYAAMIVARWGVAFPAGAAAYLMFWYLVQVSGGLQIAGGLAAIALFPAGIMFAIIVAIMAAPSAHRRLACLLFIAIAISIPVEEIIRRSLLGELKYADIFMLVATCAGAAPAYLWFGPSFRRPSTTAQRWWWLSTFQYARWSREERAARISLFLATIASWLVLFLAAVGLGEKFGVEPHLLSIVAGVALLPFAFAAARPILARLSPSTLRRADEDALARLSASPASDRA
jgi:hypothetical protein